MKKQPQISPRAREEASEWFVAFREGDADAATREAFYTWLRRSPENVHAYLRVTALWEDTGLLARSDLFDREELLARAQAAGNLIRLVDSAPSTGAGEGVADRRHDAQKKPGRGRVALSSARRGRDPRSGRVRLLAATVVLALAASFFAYQRYIADTYSTAIGEQRTITLSDGSTLVLNAKSRVRTRLSEQRRDIDLLEGQAIFRVAHDTLRPFIVHAGNTNITAVGTRFDVYRKETGTIVTVLEGKVAVESPHPSRAPGTISPDLEQDSSADSRAGARPLSSSEGEPHATNDNPQDWLDLSRRRKKGGVVTTTRAEVLLSAGQQLTVSAAIPARAGSQATQMALVPKQADLEAATAWTQGKLIFDETPLSVVVREFNRYSPRRLVIDDPDLQAFHISGVFPSSDPARIAELLRQRFGVTIHESDDELRITRQ